MNTNSEHLVVRNLAFEIVRKDIKNMHLSVNPPDGWLRLAVPIGVKEDAMRLFIVSKLSWIKRQRKKFKEQARQAERSYITGESHYLWGQRYRLNVIEEEAVPKVVVRNKSFIDLYVRPDSSIEKRAEIMREWYRTELKNALPPLLEKWQAKMDLQLNDWGVKLMRRKWGSCNIEAKRIWLNLELVKKPPLCLEYIIAHELTHLVERYHNDHFRAVLSRYMPNWELVRDELNEFVL